MDSIRRALNTIEKGERKKRKGGNAGASDGIKPAKLLRRQCQIRCGKRICDLVFGHAADDRRTFDWIARQIRQDHGGRAYAGTVAVFLHLEPAQAVILKCVPAVLFRDLVPGISALIEQREQAAGLRREADNGDGCGQILLIKRVVHDRQRPVVARRNIRVGIAPHDLRDGDLRLSLAPGVGVALQNAGERPVGDADDLDKAGFCDLV